MAAYSSIVTYEGAYGVGPRKVIKVPNYIPEELGGTKGYDGSDKYRTIQQTVAAFPNKFYANLTMFCESTSDAAALRACGFADVVDISAVTSTTPIYYYINDTDYLKIHRPSNKISFLLHQQGYSDVTASAFNFNWCGTFYGVHRSQLSIVDGSLHSASIMFKSRGGGYANYPVPGYDPGAEETALEHWCYTTASGDYDGPTINPYIDPTNPDSPTAETKPTGGNPTFETGGEAVTLPSAPTVGALSAGLVKMWTPGSDAARLGSLASFLWSTDFETTLKKFFSDPTQAIIDLHILPVTPTFGALADIKVGIVNTGVQLYPITQNYIDVDMGSIVISNRLDSALDYAPYTKYSIYLPYIGTRDISADDIVGKTINLVYRIDVLTGTCIAILYAGGTALYQWSGNCATQIPLFNRDFSQIVGTGVSAALGIAAAAATGGAVADLAVSSTISAVMQTKPNIQRASGMNGTAGLMGIQKPYLIGTFPQQVVSDGFANQVGFPAATTEMLGNLYGYTEIAKIHLKGFNCTEPELAELESLLMEGVIL